MSDAIANMLQQEAIQAANDIVARAKALKPELRQIEERKAEIEASLHAADLAHKRILDFTPALGLDYQCPRCWVQSETRSRIRPIPGTDDADVFRCDQCGRDYDIPLRR